MASKRQLIIVNACGVLHDQQVMDAFPPLQKQIDEHFLPAWQGHGARAVELRGTR